MVTSQCIGIKHNSARSVELFKDLKLVTPSFASESFKHWLCSNCVHTDLAFQALVCNQSLNVLFEELELALRLESQIPKIK